jgi:hypothetical protein
MSARRRIKFFPGIVFILVGGGLLFAAAALAKSRQDFVDHAERASGSITKLNAGSSHPDVEFTTASGETVQYAQGGNISYKVGDRVTVLYDPSDPHGSATLDDPGALWFPRNLTGGLGAFMLVMGAMSMIKFRAKTTSESETR